MNEWFRHGRKIDSIPVDDRAVQYGDGVFETIAIRDSRPRLWDLHMERLRRGCDGLSLTMPAENLLQRDLDKALARTTVNTTFCTAKILLSAGGGERGYRRTPPGDTNTLVGLFPTRPLAPVVYRDGAVTRLTETRLSCQPKLAGLKTLNRLDQVLARAEWKDDSILDGLMQDSDGRLVCGTMSNVFVVRDNHIATPLLNRCGVAGIMRRHIIRGLGESSIDCAETELSIADLEAADEVFVCNSQIGAVPVKRCDEFTWPVGECTRSVMALLAYREVPECGP